MARLLGLPAALAHLLLLHVRSPAWAAGTPAACDAHGPRVDCGYVGVKEGECTGKGCCWQPTGEGPGTPWCFAANGGNSTYELVDQEQTGRGLTARLKAKQQTAPELGPDLGALDLSVQCYEAGAITRVKIRAEGRYEVPTGLFAGGIGSLEGHACSNGSVQLAASPFAFSVSRNGTALFQSSETRLIFKEQYLELSTAVAPSSAFYGAGERTATRGMQLARDGARLALWNSDVEAKETDTNLYGSYPFLLELRPDGTASGLLLLNSNGMDIVLTEERLSFRALGGVLDLYVLAGPTPAAVTAQLTTLVGRPALPPHWALGLHNCRWGYKDVGELQAVVAGYRRAGLPLDGVWSDIDHMDGFRDFTLDPVRYPKDKMQAFIGQLHEDGQHWVPIVDPGIKIDPGYPAYDRGLERDIFVKDSQGGAFLGEVWPGEVHWPDFLHPAAGAYWERELRDFHAQLAPYDGLWIDMNEVSNFCTGRCRSSGNRSRPLGPRRRLAAVRAPPSQWGCHMDCDETGFNSSWGAASGLDYDHPPYRINNHHGERGLGYRTIHMGARHAGGELEYNVHNLYGFAEAKATHQALARITGKRPFVLTRSTFLGSGSWSAHWTGDNGASWGDLRYSVTTVLSAGLVGIPFVGPDICGFNGNTTEELCLRWASAGAFYPFSRVHNALGFRPQELYVWESVAAAARKAFGLRYQLLPYLYTAFQAAHRAGTPVAQPLWYAFPGDAATHDIHTQWLLGPDILVSPVLDEGASEVAAYFPKGHWYSAWDNSTVDAGGGGVNATLKAPLGEVPVHFRGGSIVPMQEAGLTARDVRGSRLRLVVVLGPQEECGGAGRGAGQCQAARGRLFWDQGDSLPEEDAGCEMELVARADPTGGQVTLRAVSPPAPGGAALLKRFLDANNAAGPGVCGAAQQQQSSPTEVWLDVWNWAGPPALAAVSVTARNASTVHMARAALAPSLKTHGLAVDLHCPGEGLAFSWTSDGQ